MPTNFLTSQFSTPEMDEVFSPARQILYMTRFEWALLCALETAGIAKPGAAKAMEPLLDGCFVKPESLAEESINSGNVAIPFVRELTAELRRRGESTASFVHFGATSQDVLDTALVLQMRDAFALVRTGLHRLETSLAGRAREHEGTILMGRTWLQGGPPVSLGLKIAGWLAAMRRHCCRLGAAESRAVVLQFGGAVGTLASLGPKGPEVSHALAMKLDLAEPALPWHAHRDNLAEAATSLGLLVGTLGKIARDVSLLMQTEVGEVFEPAGQDRGGSSTMPHKRNPVACAAILAVATRVPGLVATMLSAMGQEHERGLGGWQAEWETLPEIFRLSAAALARTIEIAEGLEVNRERMLANLEATHGLVLSEAVSAALTVFIGRSQAHTLLEGASKRAIAGKRHLRDVLMEMPDVRTYLSEADLNRLFDPKNYLGSTRLFIERVVDGAYASH
jgi:3-carboxy-cis,cis-muconate cycloisomerase